MSRVSDSDFVALSDDSFFSSSTSSVNTNEDYKLKYFQEHERSKKLEEKLAGYKTVVEQIPKWQEAIKELKRRETNYTSCFAKLLQEKEGQARELEELQKHKLEDNQGLTDLQVCRGGSATSTDRSSPSFLVLERNSLPVDPVYISSFQSISQQSNASSTLKEKNHKHCHQTLSSQLSEQDKIVECTGSNPHHLHTGTSLQSLQYLSHTTSKQPVEYGKLSKGTRQIPLASECIHQASNTFNTRGPLTMITFGSRKMSWQTEKANNGLDPSNSKYSSTIDDSSNAKCSATTNANETVNENDIFAIPSSTVTSFHLPSHSYGIGARPKEWKPMNLLNKTSADLKKDSELILPNMKQETFLKEPKSSDCIYWSPSNETAACRELPKLDMNNLNGHMKMNETGIFLQSMTDSNSGDLMKFPSLSSGSASNTQQENIIAAAYPTYTSHNGTITFPSDEQSQLAGRVESVATILKGNYSSSGLSDMLVKFASDAKDMEMKLNESQALNQRLQVEIQNLSKAALSDEVRQLKEDVATLKEENATLHAFITTKKDSTENEIEPVCVDMFSQQSGDPPHKHYTNSPIKKKFISLENINARLFRANKDWYNKWEMLRQQNQNEKEDLEAEVKSLISKNNTLMEEIAVVNKQIQEANKSKQEDLKKIMNLESETSQQQRQIEFLTKQVEDLNIDKRRLESEIATIKDYSKSRSQENAGNKELETEISILKQQLTIFAEDFEKERKDRALAETKTQKAKKEKDQLKLSMDTKLKKLYFQLKNQEDELRNKAKQNADLQFQVEDLKLKLQREQRKMGLAAQHSYSYQPPSTMLLEQRTHSHHPAGVTYTSTPANDHESSFYSQVHYGSPEHLPGAWECRSCTYINFPRRTVCDICGAQNTNLGALGISEAMSERKELQSRGQRNNFDDSDVVVDSL